MKAVCGFGSLGRIETCLHHLILFFWLGCFG